ncbi:MAG: hypothetical protein Q8L56_12305 [Rhodocyclaceae bacterium]|nr:hypothetical protein [Rhodocyclaceae bacterium]
MNKREPCSVSQLPPPVRKPPARVLRDWEDLPANMLVEWHPTYLVLRLVTPENAHTLHQAPLEIEIDDPGEHGCLATLFTQYGSTSVHGNVYKCL